MTKFKYLGAACTDKILTVKIEVPSGLSTVELKEVVDHITKFCDDADKVAGGSGMELAGIEVYSPAKKWWKFW